MRFQFQSRPGATTVESALVYPITFLLLLGLLIGGMGIFRYQEVAALARESSRWASVHGAQYQQETGNLAAQPQDIYNNVIVPKAASLDLSQLSYAVSWNTDKRPYHTAIVNGDVVAVSNTVTVTVTYQWLPEAYLGGITLTSSSTVAMTY
jgi:Flp pilus assembly protein TadG